MLHFVVFYSACVGNVVVLLEFDCGVLCKNEDSWAAVIEYTTATDLGSDSTIYVWRRLCLFRLKAFPVWVRFCSFVRYLSYVFAKCCTTYSENELEMGGSGSAGCSWQWVRIGHSVLCLSQQSMVRTLIVDGRVLHRIGALPHDTTLDDNIYTEMISFLCGSRHYASGWLVSGLIIHRG